MKKSLAFLTGICLALSSGLASAVTLNGWALTNPVALDASGLVNGSKNVADLAKKSHALIAPVAKDVSKVLVRGAGGLALSVAVEELLGAVDWVMDPANNQIRYKEKSKPANEDPTIPWIWKAGGGLNTDYIYSDPQTAARDVCAFYNETFKSVYWYSNSDNPSNSTIAYVRCLRKDGSPDDWDVQGKANPLYDPNAQNNEKTLPLDAVSQKIISNAQSGNTDAQVATVAAAQDILNEAENDAEKAKPIVQQLENNSTNADPNNPDPDDEKPVNDGKQSKKMNEKQIGELVGNKNWHNTALKKKIVKTYSKELRGSNNFDFYKDPKTGEIFIKGNKSKEMILINLEKFL